MSTGFYKYEKSEITSNLGTFLDNLENYNQFVIDLQSVVRFAPNSSLIHHSYLLTDYGERYFLITNSASSRATPVKKFDNIEQGVVELVSSLGYVHTDYTVHTNPPSMEFTITPKNGGRNFQLFLIPMDN